MYYRGRGRKVWFGKISRKTSLVLLHTTLDYTALGIRDLGITAEVDSESREELIAFVYDKVLAVGAEELADLKSKTQTRQWFLDVEYFPQYLKDYRKRVEENVDLAIARLGNSENKDSLNLEQWVKLLKDKWKPLASRPQPPLIGIDPRQAEFHCCQLMLFYGAEGAKTTKYSQDGGVDVTSTHFVAQVKHQEAPVGVKVIREIFGVASQEKKIGIVFAKTGFTNEAIYFATLNGVLLVSYGRYVESWTVATMNALTKGLNFTLPSAVSPQPSIDSERAILWKQLMVEVGRDKIQ